VRGPRCALRERGGDATEHFRQRALDLPSFDAEGADTVTLEVGVACAVMCFSAAVRSAVDFDGEPRFWGEEVYDDVPEDDLAAELHAEPSAAEGLPKEPLRGRGIAA